MYSFLQRYTKKYTEECRSIFGIFITCISFSALDAPPQHKSSHEK